MWWLGVNGSEAYGVGDDEYVGVRGGVGDGFGKVTDDRGVGIE